MNPAVQKTLSLILLIAIGVLLKQKLGNRDELGGVKLLILSIALPATIFVALLKIEVEPGLLFLPVLALGFNLVMLAATWFLLPWFGVARDTPAFRSYWLLVPSLAPGLSSFPFLAEYLGDESLARAALADVGNKVFVLVILYLLAMHLFYQARRRGAGEETPASGGRLRGLLLSLLREPVNLVIAAALVMLLLGWRLETLPAFLGDAVLKMSALMTPMVLLFIGMAVRFDRRQFRQIIHLLVFRSGMAFCLSAVLVAAAPALAPAAVLLAVAFPQSAISFWPFAHMSAVAAMENGEHTFDPELSLNILALSLPFSTVIILVVCSVGTVFTQPFFLAILGLGLLAAALLPGLARRRRSAKEQEPGVEYTPLSRLVEIQENA